MSHPYLNQPDDAFWSRAVVNSFNPKSVAANFTGILKKGDKVVSAGSCFASNLVPYLSEVEVDYLYTEKIPHTFSELGENLGYANFSAAYGNIYTARQLRQLYERAIGEFIPIEDRWFQDNTVIDPFRPGLKFPAESEKEFEFLTTSHLSAVRKAFEAADVFVFTLGLTESWVHKVDGATYPACPGVIAGTFDNEKYEFKNFSLSEIVSDIEIFIDLVRKRNPDLRIILTVSPVPLVATATRNHVLHASIYSKSVLRIAAENVTNSIEAVHYFPAYELITGPQAPDSFFEPDKRNVSKAGVDFVMSSLVAACGLNQKANSNPKSNINLDKLNTFSQNVIFAECDEIFLDSNLA